MYVQRAVPERERRGGQARPRSGEPRQYPYGESLEKCLQMCNQFYLEPSAGGPVPPGLGGQSAGEGRAVPRPGGP